MAVIGGLKPWLALPTTRSLPMPAKATSLIAGQGSGGIFLNAYDPLGNSLWAKGFGGPGDAGQPISVNGSGELAITGQSGSAFLGLCRQQIVPARRLLLCCKVHDVRHLPLGPASLFERGHGNR